MPWLGSSRLKKLACTLKTLSSLVKPNPGVGTGAALSAVSGVEEVHKIAGEDCFLVKLRARDTEALGDLLDNEINVIPTVAGVRTTIVLKSILEGPPLSGTPIVACDSSG